MNTTPDTIASLQTPPGRGGIAVILLRGPDARRICDCAFRPLASHARGGPGLLQLGHVVADGGRIDQAIVHRGTGFIEINIHGGPQAAKATLEQLARLGATVAPAAPAADDSFQPPHRRWANPAVGREMLQALPDARSPLVVAAVTRQWSAGISRLARTVLAELDEDQNASRLERIAPNLRAAAYGPPACLAGPDPPAACPDGGEAGGYRATARAGFPRMKKLLHPPEVVLVGPPNVGKSALTNALVGRPVSIVHQAPGTTRDWVREPALLGGVPVWLTDTAGIWDLSQPDTQAADPGPAARPPAACPDGAEGPPARPDGAEGPPARPDGAECPPAACPDGGEAGTRAQVQAESVRRARRRAEAADLVLLLSPGLALRTPPWLHARALLRVSTKRDAAPPWPGADAHVSAVTSDGLDRLRSAILRELQLDGIDPAAPAAFTRRQADLLTRAADAAESARPGAVRTCLLELLEAPSDPP